jgi:hypothetical protein
MIFGLVTSNPELPANWMPLEAVAVLKCLDEDGQVGFVIRSTATLSNWECFGLLALAARAQERDILAEFEDDE